VSPGRREPPSKLLVGRTGSRTAPGATIYRRPTAVTLLAGLDFLVSALLVVGAAGLALAPSEILPRREAVYAAAGVLALFGTLTLAAGVGVLRLKRYGRVLQIALSFLGLPAIPLGTFLSVLVLWYLFRPGVKLLFSETPPAHLVPWEIEEIGRLQRTSTLAVVLLAVLLPLLLLALSGVIAAVAVPSLLKAQVSANEASALADARAIVEAERAYAAANGGNFDELQCLAVPAECIPGYPPNGPPFLAGPFPSIKSGYHREFLGGAPAVANEVAFANLSRTSIQSFVYLAYPVSAGITGARSFCADYTGRICESSDGTPLAIVNGQCDPDCASPE
jgi:type II secretory pathway pseudopilin PulG